LAAVPASSRATALLSLSAAVVAAVGVGVLAMDVGTEPQPTPSPSASVAVVDASDVNDAFAALAEARGPAATVVDAELRAGVRIGPMFAGLRAPSSVDATLDEVPQTVALFQRVAPSDAPPELDRLDEVLDRAEGAVAAARDVAPGGSWEARFLEAQAEAVVALRGWNEASRDVHDVVEENWELWQQVLDAAVTFDENRFRYRTPEEAAATWEVEQGDAAGRVMEADAALTRAATARDEAAASVAAADERVAEIFAERPSA
jgi:hypothetical protein